MFRKRFCTQFLSMLALVKGLGKSRIWLFLAGIVSLVYVLPVLGLLVRNLIYLQVSQHVLPELVAAQTSFWDAALSSNEDVTFPVAGPWMRDTSQLVGLGSQFYPSSPEWNRVASLVALVNGDVSGSASELQQYLSLRTDQSGLYNWLLGEIFVAQGDRERALAIWQSHPQILQHFLIKGIRQFYRNELDESVISFRTAAEIAPDLCQPRYYLGLALSELGDNQNALELFTDAEWLTCDADTFGNILFQQARLLCADGMYDPAIQQLRRSVDLDPTDAKRLILLARCLTEAHQTSWNEVEGLLKDALEISDRSNVYDNLCNSARIWGNYSAALAWCDQAILEFSDRASPYYYKGKVFFEQGNYPEAIVWFKQALERDPTDLKIIVHLDQAYSELGQFEEARRMFEKILVVDPKNDYASRRLQKLSEK